MTPVTVAPATSGASPRQVARLLAVQAWLFLRGFGLRVGGGRRERRWLASASTGLDGLVVARDHKRGSR
jgi:hypothetical protein